MTTALQKYAQLGELLASYGNVVVALSGGLDSSFLLHAAIGALGKDNVYVAIGVSPSLAKTEYLQATEFCRKLGLPERNVKSIETQELENPEYRANEGNRCFFCKQELYSHLEKLASSLDVKVICDGANASDVGDHRPGMKAAQQAGVRSPLLEAGLTKEEIRELAKEFELEVWDKPQSACLASRIPYMSEVTEEKLHQIEQAEDFLKSLGFRQLRVRHHGNLARIELPVEEQRRLFENGLREQVVKRFRAIGFLFTTIDVAGFESGSMNKMLKEGEDV